MNPSARAHGLGEGDRVVHTSCGLRGKIISVFHDGEFEVAWDDDTCTLVKWLQVRPEVQCEAAPVDELSVLADLLTRKGKLPDELPDKGEVHLSVDGTAIYEAFVELRKQLHAHLLRSSLDDVIRERYKQVIEDMHQLEDLSKKLEERINSIERGMVNFGSPLTYSEYLGKIHLALAQAETATRLEALAREEVAALIRERSESKSWAVWHEAHEALNRAGIEGPFGLLARIEELVTRYNEAKEKSP